MVPDEPISVPDGDATPDKWISNYDGRFKGLIPVRQALAESRNAVAVWITGKIGIDRVVRTSQNLGIRTPLQRYSTTALGASEITLLELANVVPHDGLWSRGGAVPDREVLRDSGEITPPRPGVGPCRSRLTATRCRSSRKACAV